MVHPITVSAPTTIRPNEPTRQDVYAMVISGFSNPVITLTYLVAMVFLWLHLWHGVYSMFQSLGLTNPRFQKLIRGLGPIPSRLSCLRRCSCASIGTKDRRLGLRRWPA